MLFEVEQHAIIAATTGASTGVRSASVATQNSASQTQTKRSAGSKKNYRELICTIVRSS
jgi:hypothetical protein